MSFYHGVTVTLIDTGPRPITLPTSSVIGLVDTFTPAEGLATANQPVLVTSYREGVAKFGEDASITKNLRAIYEQASAAVVCIGVASVVDAAALKSAIIGGVDVSGQRTGLQALLDAKSVTGQTPRLLVVPGHSKDQAVATAMDSVATKLRAMAFIDGPNTDDDAAVQAVVSLGGKRLYMIDPGVGYWDTTANADVDAPASAYAAGVQARVDAEIGFWASPSNHEIRGITRTKRPIEYNYGDATSRANLLNNANIATIIRDGGFRLWGNRTLSSDPKWAFITRVRTTDMVMDALLAGHQWAVDRGITKTYVKDVTDGLDAFMRDLRNQGAIINFEVYPDPELNTASQLEQGKVYWNIRFTDVPPAENPTFRVEVTNQWLSEVLK